MKISTELQAILYRHTDFCFLLGESSM